MRDAYPILIDFEWFATDGIGHVARFTTGGEGPIPRCVLENMRLVEEACDAMANLLRIGSAQLHMKLPRQEDFETLSATGVFGYDWSDVHRTNVERVNAYEKLSSPTQALLIEDIGGALREAASLVRLEQLRFGEVMRINGERDDWILP